MDRAQRGRERAVAQGDADAEANHLRERLRSGELTQDWLRVAAALGHLPARAALDRDPPAPPVSALASWGAEARGLAGLAATDRALEVWREYLPERRAPLDALDVFRAWHGAPSAEAAETCREASRAIDALLSTWEGGTRQVAERYVELSEGDPLHDALDWREAGGSKSDPEVERLACELNKRELAERAARAADYLLRLAWWSNPRTLEDLHQIAADACACSRGEVAETMREALIPWALRTRDALESAPPIHRPGEEDLPSADLREAHLAAWAAAIAAPETLAEAGTLRARVRAKTLTHERLQLAADAGYPPACVAIERLDPPLMFRSGDGPRSRFREIWIRLGREILPQAPERAVQDAVELRIDVAIARHVVETRDLGPAAEAAVDAALECLRSPSEATRAACRAASEAAYAVPLQNPPDLAGVDRLPAWVAHQASGSTESRSRPHLRWGIAFNALWACHVPALVEWVLSDEQLPPARPYLPKETFEVGETIAHAKFGEGVVKSVASRKIQVEFPESGLKTLAHSLG